MPDEYSKWSSVFRQYRRWVLTGVFEAMPETLAAVPERDISADMIDRTTALWIEVESGTPVNFDKL